MTRRAIFASAWIALLPVFPVGHGCTPEQGRGENEEPAACAEDSVECHGSRAAICRNGEWIEHACSSGCRAGRCSDCEDGAQNCFDPRTLEVCERGVLVQIECATGRCADGACRCAPGEQRCNESGAHEMCAQDGSWQSDPCPDAQPICSDAACLACRPGTAICDGQTSERCLADGTPERRDCAEGCDFESGFCLEPCTPREHRCRDRQVAEVCRDDGQGFDVADRCRSTNGEVCSEGECVQSCDLAAQTLAPAGCSFVTPPARYWATWGTVNSAPGRLVLLLINPNPELTANVTVTTDGERRSVVVLPAGTETVSLPARPVALESRREAGAAIRITSSVPVLALAHHTDMQSNGENAYSGDAAYLLPDHLLRCGGDRYRVLAHPGMINQWQGNPYSGGIAIVSLSEEITTVQLLDLKGGTLAGEGIGAFQKGENPILDLQPNEVVYLMSASPTCTVRGNPAQGTEGVCDPPIDMTGTLLQSEGRAVALFTTGLSRVPICYTCHVQTQFSEQLPPVALWRSELVSAVRHIPVGRLDDERWTFVSDQDETTLRFEPASGGPGVQRLAAGGDQFTFDSAAGSYPGYRAFRVTAEDENGAPAPILAGRYYHTGNNSGELKGGSTFEVERPVDYWRNEYWFSGVGAGDNRIQIVVPEGEDLPLLDGAPIHNAIGTTAGGFRILSAPISSSSHHLAGTARFSLLVYGYQDLGPTRAYGYMGPLGFGDRSPSCAP